MTDSFISLLLLYSKRQDPKETWGMNNTNNLLKKKKVEWAKFIINGKWEKVRKANKLKYN